MAPVIGLDQIQLPIRGEMRRALRYLLMVSATTVGVLLFLLAVASGDSQLFEIGRAHV